MSYSTLRRFRHGVGARATFSEMPFPAFTTTGIAQMSTATDLLELSAADSALPDEVLNRNLFVVKEHAGLFKASSNFDVFDPDTGEIILQCREPQIGWFTKILRFTKYKRMTPFNVHITTPDGEPFLYVSRGTSLFLSNVKAHDEAGEFIGGFEQKLFSIGGKFSVLNDRREPICELKGKWTGWEFQFQSNGVELARVSKKWAGIGKELFTSADNYVLEINEDVPPSSTIRKLILAAVLTIDLVLKE